MRITCMFGIGSKKLMDGAHRTEGTVTEVKTCWWLKVNGKSIRTTPLDGASFPHIIHFTYQVDGTAYQGSRFVNWHLPCPRRGEKLTVYFDPKRPARYGAIVS